MRNSKIIAIAVGAALTLAIVPSIASAGPKAISGTWTYTDTTPDPSTLQNPAHMHCSAGAAPTAAAPVDVNSYTLKAKKSGTLSLVSHNALDWAMEIRDKNGTPIIGTDGADVNTPENMTALLKKGTYSVVYCNFAGEPQITVDYTFK